MPEKVRGSNHYAKVLGPSLLQCHDRTDVLCPKARSSSCAFFSFFSHVFIVIYDGAGPRLSEQGLAKSYQTAVFFLWSCRVRMLVASLSKERFQFLQAIDFLAGNPERESSG